MTVLHHVLEHTTVTVLIVFQAFETYSDTLRLVLTVSDTLRLVLA